MGNGNIKGITIEIGGNTSPLNKALEGTNKTSRDLQSELKQVEKLLKLDPTNTELLAQKQKLLADSVDNTKNKLNALKEAEKQVQQQFKEGKISEEQYRAFQREIAATEIKMNKLESQGKQTNEVLSDEKPLNNLKNIGIAAGAAVAAAGAAFAGMASAVLENADELQRQADVTGLSAERLQELQYAGNNLGVELDTITGAQAKLTKSMAAAKDGTGAQAEAFKKLHISVTDSNRHLKSAETVMSEAFTALKGVGNETERDALAMQLFGKSAMELNPLIKAGGDELNRLSKEARDSGAVMSNEAVAGLDTFGDTLDNIKSSIMGAFGEALWQLIPKIQEVISNIDMEKVKAAIQSLATVLVNLLSFIMSNGSTIISIVAGIAAGLVAWNVATMIDSVVTSIKAFKAANEGATIAQWALNVAQEANPILLIVTLIAALVAAIIVLWNTNDDFRNAITLTWEAIKDMVSKAIEAIVKAFWTVIDFIKHNWQALLLMLVNPFAGAFKLLYDNCEAFRNFVNGFVNGIIKFFKETIPNFIKEVIDWFKDIPDKMVDIGKNIIKGIWEGIKSSVKWIKDKITGFADDIVGGFKDALGIHSPSQLLSDEIGKYMAQGISVGFENEMNTVSANMIKSIPSSSDGFKLSNSSTNKETTSTGQSTIQQIQVNVNANDLQQMSDVVRLFEGFRQFKRAGG